MDTVPGHPTVTRILRQHIEVFGSPTWRRVYDNRNARLTKWLNDGIPPAQVAEWAGNSIAVLLATYARRPPAKTR